MMVASRWRMLSSSSTTNCFSCGHLTDISPTTELPSVDWRPVYIYTCVQCDHNVSLTTPAGGLAHWITICPDGQALFSHTKTSLDGSYKGTMWCFRGKNHITTVTTVVDAWPQIFQQLWVPNSSLLGIDDPDNDTTHTKYLGLPPKGTKVFLQPSQFDLV